jgi:channel protein (hemolysin III family)
MSPLIPIPGFHEPFSSLSHLLGAGIFAVLSVPLLRRGWGNGDRIAALGVYAFSCVFLLSMSGVYHLLPRGETAHDEVLARLDHGAIFVLIAGTFTPVHAILFHGRGRWLPLLVLWAAAATAIALKMVYFESFPEWLGLALYLGMGWLGAGTGAVLWMRYGRAFVQPLLWGGIAYTVGALLEFLSWPELIAGVMGPHELFHVAVLCGIGLHWVFVWRIAPGLTPALDKEEIDAHALRLAAVLTHAGEPALAARASAVTAPLPDPELVRILAAWPKLPSHYKAAMLALVEAANC